MAFKLTNTPYPKHTPSHLPGQYLTKTDGGYVDSEAGKTYTDPNNVVIVDKKGHVVDNDYEIEGNVIVGVSNPGGGVQGGAKKSPK